MGWLSQSQERSTKKPAGAYSGTEMHAGGKYGPFQVQDYLRTNGAPDNIAKFEEQILTFSDKTRGDRSYHQTLEAIKPLLAAKDSWRVRSIAVE